MTYALPWRYSTAELKGPHLIQFHNLESTNISLVHLFVTAYSYLIIKYICTLHKSILFA